MREKVGKSRNTVFFQWFVSPEGRKVGSLKRRVRSQLARWGMKNCTPLWREAHFQVKMYKTHQVRTTFGSWDVEKVHAVVARSTFRSQNVENTRGSDHFWKLRCRKSARRCGAKHISKSKCRKHTTARPLLEVEMSKSARRRGAKHISKLKCTKHEGFGPLLEVQMSFRVAGAKDCAPCQKWTKREGFAAFPETSGRSFPERGCILEHQIFRSAEMILRDRLSGKIAKRIGTRLSALHSTFPLFRKSRRIAVILMLSNAKIEEVSLNCCVF